MTDLFQSPGLQKSAVISDCLRYRYELRRTWDAAKPVLTFVMLNPSTADAIEDDPTINRCITRGRGLNMGGILVVNLFAWRATSPEAMKREADPIGPDNDRHIIAAAESSDMLIAAWGNDGAHRQRDQAVIELITRRCGKPLWALKITGRSQPKHPLYVKHADQPFIWKRP